MKYIAQWDSVSKVYTESGIPANFYNDFLGKLLQMDKQKKQKSGIICQSKDVSSRVSVPLHQLLPRQSF